MWRGILSKELVVSGDGNGDDDIMRHRNKRIAEAKKRLADAVPDAVDSMIELSTDAKAEPVRLQASKAILDQNEVYRKEEAEARASEMSEFIDQQIIYLLKEMRRKDVFVDMLGILGESATPEQIIELREQTDNVFGVGVDIIPAEVVEDEDEDEE